jgi:hypothetical protein
MNGGIVSGNSPEGVRSHKCQDQWLDDHRQRGIRCRCASRLRPAAPRYDVTENGLAGVEARKLKAVGSSITGNGVEGRARQ